MFIQSSIDRLLSVFHLLAITDNAALNILVQVSVGTYVFTFLGCVFRVEINGSDGHCVFNFLRNRQIVFTVAVPYYISTSSVKSSYFSLSLPTLVIFYLNIYLFIYLFLAALGLRCCVRAFSSCSVWASH